MTAKLLKVKFMGLNNFKDGILELDFIAERKVFQNSIDEYHVNHLFSSIYSLNTVGFVGVNASGKTTALKLLDMIFSVYVYRYGLNQYFDTKYNLIPDSESNWLYTLIDGKLDIEAYFYKDNNILKIESEINKKIDINDRNKILYFGQEKFYRKKTDSRMSKEKVFDFSEKDLVLDRDEFLKKEEISFLKPDDSIFSPYLLSKESLLPRENYLISSLVGSNINMLFENTLIKTPLSLIKYLDDNIDKLEIVESDNDKNNITMNTIVSLKFKNKNEMQIPLLNLPNYLSSGTIKGMNIIVQVIEVLNSGGYLIIDEIENHLNKNIVLNIIYFFLSPMNKHGATLILSTHYIEIIDIIPRDDSINVLIKDELIEIKKLKDLMDVSINKDKSELILGGEFGTSPNYKRYKDLYYDIKDNMEVNSNEG